MERYEFAVSKRKYRKMTWVNRLQALSLTLEGVLVQACA